MSKVFIYCDGAYIQGSTQSGYGLVVRKDAHIMHSEYNNVHATSSIRAELIAFTHALLWLKENARPHTQYVIVSDCKEIVECMVGNSMRKKNLDLWTVIEQESMDLDFKVAHLDKNKLGEENQHVLFNKKTDALAYKGATEIAKEYFLA